MPQSHPGRSNMLDPGLTQPAIRHRSPLRITKGCIRNAQETTSTQSRASGVIAHGEPCLQTRAPHLQVTVSTLTDCLATKPVHGKRGREGQVSEWWAVQDLNLWPSVCKTDALTAELTARWRAWGGSNPRPQPSQGCALIQLSYRRLSVWCRGWDLNPHALLLHPRTALG
jgi:hypothetical protein